MCGIAGVLHCSGGAAVEELAGMVDALRHRGPDDWGAWSDHHCALGHRRLSIIDLSPAGRNPLANEDGTVWIVFNGEIYNFQQLRSELEGLGHQFRTRTDTETVVHAYERWGTDCVRRLRGMFAFAIWDQRQRRLFLARDRVGKKPLFYTRHGDRFLFASELQGLLATGDVPRVVNLPAVDSYLSWGYVPAPETAFEGIYKLRAAHWLTVQLSNPGDDVRVRTERYWSLNYLPKNAMSEGDAVEALREKLTEAVRLRMISDVPLGAFLSGGIDSSVVVGLMAGLSGQPIKTFTIGFHETEYNEAHHARRVAERWATDHHEFIVRPDAVEIMPSLARHYGEPFADASALPTYYLARMTRASVTVALNGDGGDESFAGYDRYLANRLAERIRSVPLCGAAAGLAARLLPGSGSSRSQLHRLRRFLAAAREPMAARYGRWIGTFTEPEKERIYGPELRALRARFPGDAWMEQLFTAARDLNPVDATMAVDISSYLPYDLLVKVDITSMANSLEARSPLLDHEVMEFAASLPVFLKLRGRVQKYLLKTAFRDLLPPENLSRAKMGFGSPVEHWFRQSLRDLLGDLLAADDSFARRYLDRSVISEMVARHVSGQGDYANRIWCLLMLELWQQEFRPTDAREVPVPAAHLVAQS